MTDACTEEELHEDAVTITLFATMEHDASTKTSLSSPVSGVYQNLWSENEEIGVFVGENEVSKFSLKNGAGTSRGEFMGEFKDQNGASMEKTAVYPFSIVKSKSGTSVSVTLPEEQPYKSGNIADETLPMVAVTDGSELNFKNLCSVLKISMTGSLTVNSVTFTANNSNIKVSGNASIDASKTTLTMAEDASSRLVLKCDGVKLSDKATDFFIVVPSQTYTGGFSLTIDTDKGKVLKTIKSNVTLKRSELYRITPFECKIDEDNKNIIFEDASFKAYIVSLYDKDKDGEINETEALSINEIVVCTDTITSLGGIERMPNLILLSCRGSHEWNRDEGQYDNGGKLKVLNIKNNSNLRNLYCSYNQISQLDVTNNTNLVTLECDYNNISELDVRSNAKLTRLSAEYNQLSSIDLKNNLALKDLYLRSNKLNEIDVSQNTDIRYLVLSDNQLTSIDVTDNLKLLGFSINNNSLSSIDVSNNKEINSLSLRSNNLSKLDISCNNKLNTLDCSYNKAIESIDINNNTELTWFGCSDNSITSLSVENNTKIKTLYCENNPIKSLNLKNNPELQDLICDNCDLSGVLDLNNKKSLWRVICTDNNLTAIPIKNYTELEILSCYRNNISVLDVSKCLNLKTLYCTSNPLKTLYIYEGQINNLNLDIPSTTNIVVGSEPDNDEVFSVTPTLFDIDGKEQNITMAVTASMDYKLDSTPDWISQKSVESGKHTFTVTANTASSPRSGDIVFKNVNNSLLTVTVKQGIQAYTSTDYSQDGLVTKIHSATVGKGIDVVFVGDAFADKDQEVFNKYVELGKEAFFTEEPFKSTKDRFNIYRIGSVSKNGIISQEGGDTKFSVIFKGGTLISGNSDAIFSFVQNMMPSVDLRKTIIFVIINKAKYAGTCLMYNTNRAICYVPLGNDETDFSQVLRHEGCGHGFGKLADEYFYTSNGTIPDNEITKLKRWQSYAYGFYENVDLTSDPNTIAWSNFLSDSRYSGNIGVYEGGYTYPNGIYRPTEYSIMHYNTGGFNAPSREAIYKKIMKFSEGDAWTFNYEEFVEFDAPARSAEAVTRAAAQSDSIDKANFIPLAPPVMIMVDE